jgi:transcriptional regulator with XRE-family HTH domain
MSRLSGVESVPDMEQNVPTGTNQAYRSDRIRAAMASKNPPWTSAIVAEKAGVNPKVVSAARNGAPGVRIPNLEKIAIALGLSMQELFEPKEEEEAAA